MYLHIAVICNLKNFKFVPCSLPNMLSKTTYKINKPKKKKKTIMKNNKIRKITKN